MSTEEYRRVSVDSSGGTNTPDESASDVSYTKSEGSFYPNVLKHNYVAYISRTSSARFVRIRKSRRTRRVLWSLLAFAAVSGLAIIIWLSLVLTVTNRLRIPVLQNGLQQILKDYRAPNDTSPATPLWLPDFSADVLPLQCHAHNDYWHRVPLYEGLAAGCTSTEADIWIANNTDGSHDLLVGHSSKVLTKARTLRSLYLDPIMEILKQQNAASTNNSTLVNESQTPITTPPAPVGVFTMALDTSLVLLLDFKMSDDLIWETVIAQLEDFRAADWLTYWTPSAGVVRRPLTIVASGDASFEAVTANATYRDIFFDAPLMKLSGSDVPFNSNNSYYASVSLNEAVGRLSLGGLSAAQKATIVTQVQKADGFGLKSRYWDTPSWPVGLRNRVWETLTDLGASVLNLDDLVAGTKWDWEMCVVGGLAICIS